MSSSSDATSEFIDQTQLAIQSLSTIIPTIPTTTTSLSDPAITSQISALLRRGGRDSHNLCQWLYDTFHSSLPHHKLFVLRFLPLLASLYLSSSPRPSFEPLLLSLYNFQSTCRDAQAITLAIPDLSHPSIYHHPKSLVVNNDVTKLDLAVVSPSLEPHAAIPSTQRAMIVGVTLELYYTRILEMPLESKIEFCEFFKIWAGQDGDMYKRSFGPEPEKKPNKEDEEKDEDEDNEDEEGMRKKEGRIPLPWELLQPMLRILGHCLMGLNIDNGKEKKLFDVASDACRCLYARALHDLNPKAILATESLLRLSKRVEGNQFDDFDDYSKNVISL